MMMMTPVRLTEQRHRCALRKSVDELELGPFRVGELRNVAWVDGLELRHVLSNAPAAWVPPSHCLEMHELNVGIVRPSRAMHLWVQAVDGVIGKDRAFQPRNPRPQN